MGPGVSLDVRLTHTRTSLMDSTGAQTGPITRCLYLFIYLYLVVNGPSIQSLVAHTHTHKPGHPAETCVKCCKEHFCHMPLNRVKRSQKISSSPAVQCNLKPYIFYGQYVTALINKKNIYIYKLVLNIFIYIHILTYTNIDIYIYISTSLRGNFFDFCS